MQNYDDILKDNAEKDFFYNHPRYRGKKLVFGKISLENAKKRLEKEEYYALVTYQEGDVLPEEYLPFENFQEEDTLYATVDPDISMRYLCEDGKIQMISRLEGTHYLIGSELDMFSITDRIQNTVEEYLQSERKEKGVFR